MSIKEMIELRNEQILKMQGVVDKVEAENRALSEEEITMLNECEKSVNELTESIDAVNKVKRMSLTPTSPSAEELSVEDKEAKEFENIIRGIKNEDKPTTYADGQVTIPTTIANKIIDKIVEICPIFERSERFYIAGKLVLPKYDKDNSSITMAYADEGSSAESGEAKFISVELNGFLGRALAKVSNSLINNSKFDIVTFIIDKVAEAAAVFIEGELLYGTADKIDGLSGIPSAMKVTSESSTAITVDELMDTQDKVIDRYQANCFWIMSRTTRNSIRKLKDNEGQYLLNKDLTAKWGYTLLGKDVYCSDAMEEIGAGKTPVYYGDFTGLATKISEDINIQILREKYAEQHQTAILAFIEMDAKVQDTQKISKLTCASASL